MASSFFYPQRCPSKATILTSCQSVLMVLGHARACAVGLRAPACLCQAKLICLGQSSECGPPAACWGPGHTDVSRNQGVLLFCCVTFYSARQANASPGSLAITMNNNQDQAQ